MAPAAIAEIHLYHPQPYHDPRQAAFTALDARNLGGGASAPLPLAGCFVVQTDNPDYWKYMAEVLPSFFEFREQIGPWPDAPGRP